MIHFFYSGAKDLIRRLLIVDKSRRYTAIDVLSHPWIVCGGNTQQPLPGITNISTYCKEIKKDLVEQAKHNYENYQMVKAKKNLLRGYPGNFKEP
jgi:serine/threonine protein kinase